MRQALAKGQRREIRRAFGAAALETLSDQEQATGLLANGLRGVHQEVAALALDHATFKKDSRALRDLDNLDHGMIMDSLIATGDRLDRRIEPLTRGFLGRLRWLVLGS